MKPKIVRKLEKELYKAVADVICRLGLKTLPLLPSPHTMEMMAKAAPAVCETAGRSLAVAWGTDTAPFRFGQRLGPQPANATTPTRSRIPKKKRFIARSPFPRRWQDWNHYSSKQGLAGCQVPPVAFRRRPCYQYKCCPSTSFPLQELSHETSALAPRCEVPPFSVPGVMRVSVGLERQGFGCAAGVRTWADTIQSDVNL